MKKNRNGFIDALKFLASIIIAINHFGCAVIPFRKGWLFVEVFFALSGFFGAEYIENKLKEKTPSTNNEITIGKFNIVIYYTKKQYQKILPYFLICVFWYYGFFVFSNADIRDILFYIYEMPIDLLLLNALGIDTGNVGITWYLSVYFISLPIALYLFSICKSYARKYVFSVTSLIGYSFIISRTETIATTFGFTGLIRGLSGMMMGFLAFELANTFFKKINRTIALTGGFMCFLIMIAHITLSGLNKGLYDICFIVLSVIFISILGSIKFNNNCKILTHLSNISLPIYLFHIPVIKVAMRFDLFGDKIDSITELAIYLLLVIFVCEAIYVFVKKFFAKNTFNKIKSLFNTAFKRKCY